MNDDMTYVKIVGEPFLTRVKEYRSALRQCHAAWRAFAAEKGATKIPGGLTGLCFSSGIAPDGWKKPERKNGWSRPVKGHPDEAILRALPKEPDRYAVFGGNLIDSLSYEGPGESGSGTIGSLWFGPLIGWAGETYFACIPDAKRAADKHLAKYPDHQITNGADKWSLPDGLERISEAEHDLIVAQYEVEQERAAKAA